jgi:hypothetical protein
MIFLKIVWWPLGISQKDALKDAWWLLGISHEDALRIS